MTKQTFKISGMHCVACALNIDMDLEEVPGVKNSQTNYAKQETTVEFDPAKVTPQTLISTIAKTGYQVVA